MVKLGLPELQELMSRYLEQDREKNSIDSEGSSLAEAIRNAAIQLGVKVPEIEYELIEEGSEGILGFGKKAYKIRAYPVVKKEEASFAQSDADLEAFKQEAVIINKDGEAFVHLSVDGALLKVTAPLGHGKTVNEKQAQEKLHERAVRNYDAALVAQVVKQAQGEYVRVGEFISNPASDAMLTVDIAEQEMKAYVTMLPPGPGGCDLSYDAIVALLRNNRVISCLIEEALHELEDKPKYKESILVADGLKPINGKDAYIQYNFDIDQSKIKLKESTGGKVNFKELNLIQNVVQGQPLARKVPAEKGINGKTVTGKMLPSRNGKDIPLPLGRNVHALEDGVTIVSDINGQVMLTSTKINVEEVYTVEGDVSLRTGNIIFLGTVVVRGSVEDGFQVKASGNIEVIGNVGKAELEAEGDIIVHQGISSKTGGRIHAGRSVWARFIENANVEAEDSVIVADGIMNSKIDSNKKIVCHGKRASIVGGHLRAAEEINAKILGSAVGGAETILEVGYDPKSKVKMEALQSQVDSIRKQIDEYDKNIFTLQNIKKQKKSLPEEKEALLLEQIERKTDLTRELSELTHEIEGIQTYLNQLKTRGKISASGKVFPGVKLTIKDVSNDVKNENKGVTYFLENNFIRTTKYEEIDDELIKKGPPEAF